MAERIQLRRTKGWRKPEGAVVVSRPTRWGNPFRISDFGAQRAVELYEALLQDGSVMTITPRRPQTIWAISVLTPEKIRAALAGRDLACWCPLDRPCHADVLLRIANGDD